MTIKITTHPVGINFGTCAVVKIGRKRIVGGTRPYGFTSAAIRDALSAARHLLTADQVESIETEYAL